jgi:hypothetical protein
MANGDDNTRRMELATVPIAELIRTMAMSVAEAQLALDKSSLMVAEFMCGRYPARDPDTGQLVDGAGAPTSTPVMLDSRIPLGQRIVEGKRVPSMVSLMELGFVPNFYQFVETVIELKIALRVTSVEQRIDPATGSPSPAGAAASGWSGVGAGRSVGISGAPIDAGYASSYGFNLELASTFKTKLVPVPPPATLEERLRQVLRDEAAASADTQEAKP